MKKFLKVIWSIFAVIGILAVAVILFFCDGKRSISIRRNTLGRYNEYVELLRTASPMGKDTTTFEMKIIQDSARAKEIRDYFNLDSLYDADADTWTKAIAIGRFVASSIPHDNQKIDPEHRNAIDLWEYTKNVAPAFNCRLHSILAFELFLATGIDARYVTCLPEDREDNDCHVVNEVWLPEMGKWAMIDTDMGGHYFSDINGIPLSLREMRDHYISGEEMILYPQFKKDGKKKRDHRAYMAKNTYWFYCWETLSYNQEDGDNRGRDIGRAIHLVPPGFEPFIYYNDQVITSDADTFWAAPVKSSI